MKHISKEVETFYRLRLIVTFESGRVYEQVLGPYTTERKAKEIETRMARGWNRLLIPKQWRDADSTVKNIQYIREILPALGWFATSTNEYVPD